MRWKVQIFKNSEEVIQSFEDSIFIHLECFQELIFNTDLLGYGNLPDCPKEITRSILTSLRLFSTFHSGTAPSYLRLQTLRDRWSLTCVSMTTRNYLWDAPVGGG
ncbi:hypothetical protein CEXT_196561 [Caerostris extrusa]|uniref:Maturase K n=1 Tax=Caerostris extrusa TaxID=172846 RepID=A0AAV4S2F5_CAEEX|nr:hypothetical protein CEXT_196561 [Caerostris extrusa]